MIASVSILLEDASYMPRVGVVAYALNCGLVVREFEIQSSYYVHFRTDTLKKGMDPPPHLAHSSNGLNSTTTVFLQGWLWY